ncbi:putative cellulose synthase A catalytic subunit 8 [UDP-forming]-like [Capsicum annuum]|nr:putative cellulose synthase A catalytic subunit 8 [UDP-forming]-like [Capsicum annuum]
MRRITKIPKKFLFFMVSFPCIVLLYHRLLYLWFNWLRMYENLIGLLTRDHGGSECIVVAMAWLLSSYAIILGTRAILLLWNPSTRESIVLPRTEFSLTKDYSCGLGYDSTSNDYKILKIDDAAHCEILALKSGSWRKIDKRPSGVFSVLSDTEDSLAFVQGAFHWLDALLENPLISFSISNEVYGEIPLPEGMSLVFNMDCINGVSALGGMLCVYSTHIIARSTHSS